jgi:hypothetical protein
MIQTPILILIANKINTNSNFYLKKFKKMKTQKLFMRGVLLFSLLVMALMLWQCACCPPLSRFEKPTFNGCWMTEYSHPSSADTSIKGDIFEKDIPVEINVNADGTVSGNWWSFPVSPGEEPAMGVLTGNISNDTLRGKWGDEASRDIDFQLAATGLSFDGTYGPPKMWGTTRRFYWKGIKISNCKCPKSVFSNAKNTYNNNKINYPNTKFQIK